MYPSLKVSQPHQFPQPRRYSWRRGYYAMTCGFQYKTLPSTEIRNILVRSISEAPVVDFLKKLLENPMNISATWGAWSLASVVFSCVSWHRVHTYGSKIDTRLLQHKNVQEVTGRTSSPAWNLSKPFAYCSIGRTLSGIVQLKTWAII